MGSPLIDSGQAETQIEGGVEFETVDVSTDASGNGSTTVSWSREFRDSDVAVFVSGQDTGDFYPSSAGSSQATVQVSGATADATVTVHVLAVGDR
jgi:hypothetical protein